MAQDINNFIDPNLLDSLTKINTALVSAGNNIDKIVVPAINKLVEAQAKLGKENTDNESKRTKLTAAEKEAARIAKSLTTTEAKINGLRTESGKKLTEQKLKLQQLTAAEKEAVKTASAHEKSLVRMRQKLKDLTTAYDNTGNRTKAAAAAINKLSTQIEKAEKVTNRHGRGVGGYAKQMKGLAMQFAGALGLTSAIFLFVNVIKGSFNTIREFTKQNAVLAGVLGKTRKEVSELTDQAINLGSAYPVTASEVNKLQISFARLGFTQAEIIDLTEATIQGSIALNSELDATATLVGAVVKAYSDLGTEHAGEIIDKLTLSTQKSSLSFSGLETALPKVAAAASAMDIKLSKTLTHLGLINDATLDASISGTSLRNIYLVLAEEGITLDEALSQINGSSNKLSASFDLFGKRGAIAGLALANAGDKADEFESAVDNAGGTAQRVAEEQMATLDGAMKSTASSWEKLVLAFKNSEGFFSSFFEETTDLFDNWSSDYLNGWQKFISTFSGGASRRLAAGNKELASVLSEISSASHETELAELERHYASMLGENEAFDKDFLAAVESRYDSLEKEASDAATRATIAANAAELKAITIAKEASIERIKVAKKESEARVQAIIDRFDAEREYKAQQGIDETSAEDEINAEVESEQVKQDALIALEIEATNEKLQNAQYLADERTRINQEEANELVRINQEKAMQIIDTAVTMGDALGALASGQIKSFKDFSKEILLIALDALEKRILVTQVAILASDIASKGFFGVGTAAIKVGLIKAAFTAIKGAVMSFAKGTDYAPGGISELAEEGRELVQNPDGKVWMAENRGLYNLQQGSKVITNQRTEAILNDKRMVGGLARIERAIKRQPRQRNESEFSKRQRGYSDGYRSIKHRMN